MAVESPEGDALVFTAEGERPKELERGVVKTRRPLRTCNEQQEIATKQYIQVCGSRHVYKPKNHPEGWFSCYSLMLT